VHPLQWPYDELLLALALSQNTIEKNKNDFEVNIEGSSMEEKNEMDTRYVYI
jgi:SOS-response transcriptional repressor LexA